VRPSHAGSPRRRSATCCQCHRAAGGRRQIEASFTPCSPQGECRPLPSRRNRLPRPASPVVVGLHARCRDPTAISAVVPAVRLKGGAASGVVPRRPPKLRPAWLQPERRTRSPCSPVMLRSPSTSNPAPFRITASLCSGRPVVVTAPALSFVRSRRVPVVRLRIAVVRRPPRENR